MIRSINGKITKDIVEKGYSRKLPNHLNKRSLLLMQALSDVRDLADLKKVCEPPSLKLHKLKGSMKEYWSITIEKPWCIIFKYKRNEFYEVEIGDYHD